MSTATEDPGADLPGFWDTSLPDWKERIASGRSLIPDLPLFDKVADKALRIFRRLRIPDVAGTPTFGEVSGDWVFDFVRAVFGSYDPDRRVRMIREFFLLVPKGNAKTTLAAAIILVAAIMNERPHAELMLIAPSQKIAKRAFRQAEGMIRLDPALIKLFDPKAYQNEILLISEEVPSRIVIVSADPSVVTGAMATFTLIDETHEFARMNKAADVFAEIKGSLGKRPDGFLLQITTQSKSEPAGVFKQELKIARMVRDGEMRQSLLPVLYELPPEMAAEDGWRDEKTWGLVNPNLNKSVTADYIRAEIEKAEIIGPHQLALIASQHLNVEIGQGLHADRWPGALYWNDAGFPWVKAGGALAPTLTLDGIMERSDVCVVGIDGGGLDDLMAIAVIGRHRKSRAWLHWSRAWAHPEVFDRRKEIAPRLRDFLRDGDLVLCEDTDQDAREIAEICVRLRDAGRLPEKAAIGLDAFGVATVLDHLAEAGIDGDAVMAVGQGYRLQAAITTLPRKLKDKTFRHCGQPMMTWVVGNAKTELKGSNYVVTKQAAGAAKIDPLMATFNAAMLMFLNPEAAMTATPWDLDPNYRMAI